MSDSTTTTSSTGENPHDQVGSRSKDSTWYEKELLELQPAARELLEKYSGIPPADVEAHIYDIRDKAWQIFPYPCIGGFRFLSLSLSTFPNYPALLATLREPGAVFLDLGCCFGTEIRRLVFDGVSPETCIGTDLRPEFFELGYELYRDRERMAGARFFAADVFDAENQDLAALDGKVDVLCAGSFFHLFDLEGQTRAAERVARLLKRNVGAVVVGRQVGSVKPGLHVRDAVASKGMYRHDAQTWREMWDGVGRTVGVQFEVECRVEDAPRFHHRRGESDTRMLYFTVKMLG